MSDECSSQACAGCQTDCADRKTQPAPEDLRAKPHEASRVGRVIGVLSGKGGVGKSLVTALLASALKRRGAAVGLMDADVTGPCLPRLFGLKERARTDALGLYPVPTRTGLLVMSLNLLLENEDDPVIWRGPVIGGLVKQFWTEVVWGDLDYLFIDMPPGTGDVPLTVFQSLPVDGLIVVTSPQEVVGLIVEKALNMARMMDVPVLGLVENMSYFQCPDCGRPQEIFGPSRAADSAARHGLSAVARLPIDPLFARKCDAGEVEDLAGPWLDGLLDRLELLPALPRD